MLDWFRRDDLAVDEPLSRRQFLKMGGTVGLASTALALFPAEVLAKPAKHRHKTNKQQSRERALLLYNTHTGESLKTVYWAQGHYVPEGLRELNFLLRDHHSGEVVRIDPVVYDILYGVRAQMEYGKPIHVISAYRSPATNAMLREQSEAVAAHSLHMDGMAVDLRIPGRRASQLRKAAMRLKRGGVGYYPWSNFIHVDTGPVRYW